MYFFAFLCRKSSSAVYWYVLASNESIIESMVENQYKKYYLVQMRLWGHCDKIMEQQTNTYVHIINGVQDRKLVKKERITGNHAQGNPNDMVHDHNRYYKAICVQMIKKHHLICLLAIYSLSVSSLLQLFLQPVTLDEELIYSCQIES